MDPDRNFMAVALNEARLAAAVGDVPVGCVVARRGEVLATAHNMRERSQDPTAHAEIIALQRAAATVGSWRLDECTVYVTLEPCSMCAGALVLARVKRLVMGAMDPKAGAVGSLYNIPRDGRLNHSIEVAAGVRADESSHLLRDFFAARRT
jgi:tRNA(adenine34) deaminase